MPKYCPLGLDLNGYRLGKTAILNDGKYTNMTKFRVSQHSLIPVNCSSTHTLSCGSSSSRREIIPAIRQKVCHDYEAYAKIEDTA